MEDRENKYNSLPLTSKKAWRIHYGMWSVVLALVPIGMGVLFYLGDTVSLWILLSTTIAVLFGIVLLLALIPGIRWKQWRYRVDEHEIDLEHGIFIITRTLIPIKRVQHVDTRQGPVLRSYNLADVVISTAATTHKIPALTETTADRVRSEISTFARKAKEDV